LIKAELLQDATDAQVKRFMTDPTYVWEEKHNGDRRLIAKQGLDINDFNRNGEPAKGLPPNVIDALRKHPLHKFVIDAEYVYAERPEKIYVFDMLHSGDDAIVALPLSARKGYLHSAFDGFHPDVPVVESAATPQEKLALIERIMREHGEGFVMKDLTAPYRPSDGNRRWNFKYKFWKTTDCVVLGPSPKGHDSVRVGVYDETNKLIDIGGISLVSKEKLAIRTVVEVKYLYSTRNRHIVQPSLLRVRTDKEARECTTSQLVTGKGQ
jgi:ATP-dependent DNA ligase